MAGRRRRKRRRRERGEKRKRRKGGREEKGERGEFVYFILLLSFCFLMFFNEVELRVKGEFGEERREGKRRTMSRVGLGKLRGCKA